MTPVQAYGAVGDGQTDDTNALQHALDVPARALTLPPGTYRITRPLVVRLDQAGPFAIDGSGGSARILMDGDGPALHILGTHLKGSADPNSFADGVWLKERMPTVANLEIVGTRPGSDGIRLQGTMQATIRGVLIRRCRYGVHLVERNRNLLLADSHIYHGQPGAIGVFFDAVNLHQANIDGCHISYQPHAGIKVVAGEIRNLQITGCDIEYNFDPEAPDSADVWIDSRQGTIREGTISGCTIQAKLSPGGSNVRIDGPDLPDSRGAGLWTITGNVLQSQAVNVRLTSCRAVTLAGNSFASGYERSVVVQKCNNIVIGPGTLDYNPDYTGDRFDGITVTDSRGVTLTGLVLHATRGGSAEAPSGAIHVERSSEVMVANCQVLDPEYCGVFFQDVQHAHISGCTILDRRNPRQMVMAVAIDLDGSEGVLVANNLLGVGAGGFDVTQIPEPLDAHYQGNLSLNPRP
jgi:polygalacturonase